MMVMNQIHLHVVMDDNYYSSIVIIIKYVYMKYNYDNYMMDLIWIINRYINN